MIEQLRELLADIRSYRHVPDGCEALVMDETGIHTADAIGDALDRILVDYETARALEQTR